VGIGPVGLGTKHESGGEGWLVVNEQSQLVVGHEHEAEESLLLEAAT
jgi:hypothetical protein